ncbi:MAG TPA: PAS domain-containing protein [Verrucomicrobiae bacterium]|nr:PAS domain-containing protein [Verrucomicrobiae bacterium]
MDPGDRYESLFEQAPFSMQRLDPTGRTLRVNAAWKRLWNIDGPGLEFVLGEYNILEDPQLEKKGIAAYLRRAFAGETVEMPTIAYDPAELGIPGRICWVSAHAHPIRDSQGRIVEVMLIHQDVTERKRFESELSASEQRLRQIANSIPQLAWMADSDGSILWYNDRWYQYTGATAEEMAGFGWQAVHHPDWLPRVLERIGASVQSGAPFEMTFPLRARDGSYRPFFSLATPLKDESGRVVHWFGTNTDVSSLEAAELELRKAEERLRLATEAGDIGIWDWRVRDDRMTWSDRTYALHGLAPGTFGGTLQAFEALVHPDDLPGLREKISAAVAARDTLSAEFRVLLPDGRVRWLATWARMHLSPDGVPVRMIGATVSVDDYKRAEASMRENDRRKDEFLAMLAHELRNPMAPIQNAAELLAHGENDSQIAVQAGEIITRQVRHMTKLIDDLLDVSRVTRGLVKIEVAPVELSDVVAAAVEQARPVLDARQHALSIDAAGTPLWVRGDRTRLVQVLVNLLDNAAKYTPPRGRIQVSLRRNAGLALIAVSDNGLGIEASLRPHVFDLFTQGPRSPDRSQGGLGIGLSVVRSLVELHGGSIDARSAGKDRGSVFTIRLATIAATAAAAPIGKAARDVAMRVVVVDDNQDAAAAVAALLRAHGCEVRQFADAEQVLADPPREIQAFVVDLGLPGMDGYDLVRELRRRGEGAPTRFVALTGYGQPGDVERAKESGFDAHLVKPASAEQILAAIRG